ncbi:SDR family NAD(P)-dependent oxidoreductase [soil metagenome]
MLTPQVPIESGFTFSSTAEDVAQGIDLADKTFVITGGHVGLGLETVRVLAAQGAKIIIGARNKDTAATDVAKVLTKDARPVTTLTLDLSDATSVLQFAKEALEHFPKINVLINNAGIMALPELRRNNRGFEMQFATNHIGHFILAKELDVALQRAASKSGGASRVISLSSAGHRFSGVNFEDPNYQHRPYEKWASYGQSKTANSLFAVGLDAKKKSQGVRAFAVHPGRIIETALTRNLTDEDREAAMKASPSGRKNIPQGAATTVWSAISPSLEGAGGVYCADCDISELVPDDSQSGSGVRRWAVDPMLATQLWKLTEELIR